MNHEHGVSQSADETHLLVDYSANFGKLHGTVSTIPDRLLPDGVYQENGNGDTSDSVVVEPPADNLEQGLGLLDPTLNEQLAHDGQVKSVVRSGSVIGDEASGNFNQTTVTVNPAKVEGIKVTNSFERKKAGRSVGSIVIRRMTHGGGRTLQANIITKENPADPPNVALTREYSVDADGTVAIKGNGAVKKLTGKRAEDFKKNFMTKTTADISQANTAAEVAIAKEVEYDSEVIRERAEREQIFESRLKQLEQERSSKRRPAPPVWTIKPNGKSKSSLRVAAERLKKKATRGVQ